MEAQELASYKYQLEQVEALLADDPDNAEMLKLKTDLQELISLSAGLVSEVTDTRKPATTMASSTPVDKRSDATAASTTSPTAAANDDAEEEEEEEVDVLLRRVEADMSSRPISMPDEAPSTTITETPNTKWAVGDRIRARYKNDGKFYSARVVSVGGSDAAPVYSVVFKGYEGDAPEVVAHADTCRLMSAKASSSSNSSSSRAAKRSASTTPLSGEDAEKRVKGTAARKQRQQEQRERQQSWLSFATGGKKKTVKKTGVINKKSIFASPDSATGRVGVVGSGRPMTQFGTRNKHVYESK